MGVLERGQDFSQEDVAPSFLIEKPRKTIVGTVIAVFHVRGNNSAHVDARPRNFQPRPEPPLEKLSRPMPNYSPRRTGNTPR